MNGASKTATATPEVAAETIRVDLAERGYDLVVGEGLMAETGPRLAPLIAVPRVIVISDETVAPIHLPTVQASLDGAGIDHESFLVPAGEESKDFAVLQDLVRRLLDVRIDRATTLIALGGGMVGDLAGFAASIVLRGLDMVQIPTTLLSQVDSSVGGKTGINTEHGKNLVGTYHQPRLVLADIDALDSLPAREILAGYAEVAKYGLLGDRAFFAWLETNGEALCAGDKTLRRHAVYTSCAAKAAIVADDERETGQRALLNLGHTFAHAIEVERGYGTALLHGEAVGLGLCLAFDLSVRLGLCAEDAAHRVRRHLDAIGLPTRLATLAETTWTAEVLVNHMRLDKKVRGGVPAFVLARDIGDAFISRDVDLADVAAVLEAALAR